MQDIDNKLNTLIKKLSAERKEKLNFDFEKYSFEKRFNLLRFYMNLRPAKPLTSEVMELQDDILKYVLKKRNIIDVMTLQENEPGISLYQGDITTLKADAIVNAANSAMQGCFMPGHNCIDNVIHTYAGMQLRLFCHDLIRQRKAELATGDALITPAFNLPALYVIHTVGPIIFTKVDDTKCTELKNSYLNSLKLACDYKLKSIVFPCISTGEFHFPQDLAAQIAIDTIRSFLKGNNYKIKVIFNVFKDSDATIYRRLLDKNAN